MDDDLWDEICEAKGWGTIPTPEQLDQLRKEEQENDV